MSKSEYTLAIQIKNILLGLNKYSRSNHISLDDNNILHIEKLPFSIRENIVLDGFDLDARFMRHKSPLQDDMVNMDKIDALFEKLSELGGNLLLNHIGFCYKETDIKEETARLLEFCRLKKLGLYHETLVGFDPWFFVGDKEDKSSPMLEFLPTTIIPPDWEKTKDHWLPQVQIDIDTDLNSADIAQIYNAVFEGKTELFTLFKNNNGVILYRLRIGVLDGVNINLDIGTSERNTLWYRNKILKKL